MASEFDTEFRLFALADARRPAPRNAVLFYGSSSIRLWDSLARDFPEIAVVNRGFGGSTLLDCAQEVERLVVPLTPRAMVLYAGENDLDQGRDPQTIPLVFAELVTRVNARLGPIPIVFISIKPSVARDFLLPQIRTTNALMRATTDCWEHTHFLEVFSLMVDAHGHARRELFTEDGLHMSAAGYQLWTSQVRPKLAELRLLDPPRIPSMV